MYFYVDESENTGTSLFDLNQPTLYYGVLAPDDLVTADPRSQHPRPSRRHRRGGSSRC